MVTDTTPLKEYFRKLQRVIINDADFRFLSVEFIKKNRNDDILCCILATLPEAYKRKLRSSDAKKFNSMIAYNVLFDAIKRKCPFSSEMYMVDTDKAIRLINSIVTSIQRDVDIIEKDS